MISALPFALVGALLFTLGAGAFLVSSHLLRRLLALNIAGSGIFLSLVALAQRSGLVDPVAQALVLTGIVVAISATALGVVLLRRFVDVTGRATLDEPRPAARQRHRAR